MHGIDLTIAHDAVGRTIDLDEKQRGRHLYLVGTTGSGKSKFLEYLIRQDILDWNRGDHSILLLDWTGAIYEGLMHWLAGQKGTRPRPVIPIDLGRDDYVMAYNFVRKREGIKTVPLVDHLLKQLSYIWGET